MTAFLKYAWEILFDAFFQFRSPTAKCLNCNRILDKVTEPIRRKLKDNDLTELDKYINIAMSIHNEEQENRKYSMQKSYQILAFNMALNVFIASAFLKEIKLLDHWRETVAYILLALIFYTGTKSALHCLIAIANRGASGILPKFYSDIKTVKDGRETYTNLKLELLRNFETIYEKNEDQRAIIAEHAGISIHTFIVQVVVVGLLLCHIFILPWFLRNTESFHNMICF